MYYGNVSNKCSRSFEVILWLIYCLFALFPVIQRLYIVAITARFAKVLTKNISRVFLGITPIPKFPIVNEKRPLVAGWLFSIYELPQFSINSFYFEKK